LKAVVGVTPVHLDYDKAVRDISQVDAFLTYDTQDSTKLEALDKDSKRTTHSRWPRILHNVPFYNQTHNRENAIFRRNGATEDTAGYQ
jgi:hypothetical protein